MEKEVVDLTSIDLGKGDSKTGGDDEIGGIFYLTTCNSRR